MGLFSRREKKVSGTPGGDPGDDPGRRVELILPVGSTVTGRDLGQWLATWAGVPELAPLPAGLVLSGPRAALAERAEPEGAWVWAMSWGPRAAEPRPFDPNADGWADLLDSMAWLYDAARNRDGQDFGGPREYALGAVTGLARRTRGLVRPPKGHPLAPADPEATWSVYVRQPPAAQQVADAVAGLWTGAAVAPPATPGGSWVLEAPDGCGAWLDNLELSEADDWEDFPGPGDVAFCALARLGPNIWAVRVEGSQDTADPAAAAHLAASARLIAAALGGVAVDPDGYPLD